MSSLTQGAGRKMTPAFVVDNVVATRATPGSGRLPGFTCRCCGGYTHSIADMAQVLGVGASTLSKWLKKAPIRQDISDSIRASFSRVEE